MIWKEAHIYLWPQNGGKVIQLEKLKFLYPQSSKSPMELAGFDHTPPFSPVQNRQRENTEDSIFVTTEILYSEKNQQIVSPKVNAPWHFT